VTLVAFTVDEANALNASHRFNCGPAALCAVTGLRPIEALAVITHFAERGYTNPKMMAAALTAIGASWRRTWECSDAIKPEHPQFPEFGLVRVQWDGPWCKPGVPAVARYFHSHWIAVDDARIFDINCLCVGGWVPWLEWDTQVVPWLLKDTKASGNWWPTKCWDVARP